MNVDDRLAELSELWAVGATLIQIAERRDPADPSTLRCFLRLARQALGEEPFNHVRDRAVLLPRDRHQLGVQDYGYAKAYLN
jgi:hypothetical protein